MKPGDSVGTALVTTKFEIKFDRFMLANDVIRQAMCLHSQSKAVTRPSDCTDAEFLEPHYDPVSRIATYFQDPASPVVPDQLYTLTVFRYDGNLGFRAFDGVPLDQTTEFSFTAAATTASVEVPSTANGWCGVGLGCGDFCGGGAGIVMRGSCTSCHDTVTPAVDPGLNKLLDPAMGLVLTSLAGIEESAKDKPAHGSQKGGAAQRSADTPLRFGDAMAIVKSGNPGQSYLLYKILSNINPVPAQMGAPALPIVALDPDDPDDVLAEGEAERLQRSVVTGMSMPPQSSYNITHKDAETISAWIDAGAQLPVCPE